MLRVALEGLARQDFPSDQFEVVVVSDGATDGTDTLLAELAVPGKLPYCLRPILQENGGPARARNRGIQEARGDVVVFLDDDVEAAPQFLSAHAAHHADNEQIVVIGPMSPDPQLRGQEPCWIAWEHAMLEKQYAAWRTGEWESAGPNHFYSGNASVRRAHLLQVGGFDETFKRQEDVEMAYRMERECNVRFTFDATALGIHRPDRTLSSWRRVPLAYGNLDVVRARRGDVRWELLQQSYHQRNRLTQRIISLWLRNPANAQPLESVLVATARSLYAMRLAKPSLNALSALYNLLYMQGVYEGLEKNPAEMRALIAREGIYAN
ncbi:MAG: glycosyltransferase family 2 protein [Armatimonadaceae bacterium]